jgi:hypothetical protein
VIGSDDVTVGNAAHHFLPGFLDFSAQSRAPTPGRWRGRTLPGADFITFEHHAKKSIRRLTLQYFAIRKPQKLVPFPVDKFREVQSFNPQPEETAEGIGYRLSKRFISVFGGLFLGPYYRFRRRRGSPGAKVTNRKQH